MPWYTPTLKEVRALVRDSVKGQLPGADAAIGNSVLRVMSDAQGALCHLTLQYIDWLSLMLLPDTAQGPWLDRHGDIWLVNSDGTVGRKKATLASGSVLMTGTGGAVVPNATQLTKTGDSGIVLAYETTAQVTILANQAVPVPVAALIAGSIGNCEPGDTLALLSPPPLVNGTASVVTMTGGTDEETDDELRARILLRIRNPPMGGDQNDYVQWALAVPGCTRAWCFPNEMGIGTVTVRVMFDDLRATRAAFRRKQTRRVTAYIDQMRPVTVKDRWVLSPIPQPIDT